MAITKCSRVGRLLPERSCIVLAVFHVWLSLPLLLSEKLLIAFTCTTGKTPSISLIRGELPSCCVRRNLVFSINQQPKRQTIGPARPLKQGLNMDLFSLRSRLLETAEVSLFKQSGKIVQREESSSVVVSGTLINLPQRVRVEHIKEMDAFGPNFSSSELWLSRRWI